MTFSTPSTGTHSRRGYTATADNLYIDTTASRRFKTRIGRCRRRRAHQHLSFAEHVKTQQRNLAPLPDNSQRRMQ